MFAKLSIVRNDPRSASSQLALIFPLICKTKRDFKLFDVRRRRLRRIKPTGFENPRSPPLRRFERVPHFAASISCKPGAIGHSRLTRMYYRPVRVFLTFKSSRRHQTRVAENAALVWPWMHLPTGPCPYCPRCNGPALRRTRVACKQR